MNRQRGHGDMGMTFVIGWVWVVIGVLSASGGVWALVTGLRMVLR